MFLTEVLHVQELKSHVSQKETAIGYAGVWPWRMMLVWRWQLQYCDFQQQKAVSPHIQLENTVEIWQEKRSQRSLLWQIRTDNTERSHRLLNQEGEANEAVLNQPKKSIPVKLREPHERLLPSNYVLEANTQKWMKHRPFQTVQIRVGLRGFAPHLHRSGNEVNGGSGCASYVIVEVIISRERRKTSSRAKALAWLGLLCVVQGACRWDLVVSFPEGQRKDGLLSSVTK